ncbi:hypothetical protein [methane-oxidizing endosymbiont of Gigantopelta aegis]|uniref:hypothetical protein n=1 Tax=methane-oxidizing endosymbiont of Gigantopelta aegis TaxID=2794938 RepID=UPI0018DDB61B|nr:hypothetical protein [methane-oxidizing endosymbiont of Gigantopelta aegis]
MIFKPFPSTRSLLLSALVFTGAVPQISSATSELTLSDTDKSREIKQLRDELKRLKETVNKLENHLIHLQEGQMRKRPKAEEPGYAPSALKGISVSGQTTVIYQSSSLNLKPGQLFHADGTALTNSELAPLQHNSGDVTFSADLGAVAVLKIPLEIQ